MNTQMLDQKLELIQWLSALEDKAVIEKLVQFKASETRNRKNNISEEEIASIEKGIKDAENNKLNTHTTARKLYEKWL